MREFWDFIVLSSFIMTVSNINLIHHIYFEAWKLWLGWVRRHTARSAPCQLPKETDTEELLYILKHAEQEPRWKWYAGSNCYHKFFIIQ